MREYIMKILGTAVKVFVKIIYRYILPLFTGLFIHYTFASIIQTVTGLKFDNSAINDTGTVMVIILLALYLRIKEEKEKMINKTWYDIAKRMGTVIIIVMVAELIFLLVLQGLVQKIIINIINS